MLLSSIFYHLNEIEFLHNDEIGFLHRIQDGQCYGTIKKIHEKFEFRFSEDSFSHFIVEAENIEEAFDKVMERFSKIRNTNYYQLNINKNYQFNYYDWSELASFLNIEVKDLSEPEMEFMIVNYLWENPKELIPIFKEFTLEVCKPLVKRKVLEAICDIDDELVFCREFGSQLRGIWN